MIRRYFNLFLSLSFSQKLKIILPIAIFSIRLLSLDATALADSLNQLDDNDVLKNFIKEGQKDPVTEHVEREINEYLNEKYKSDFGNNKEDNVKKFVKGVNNFLNKKIYFDNLTVGSILKMVSLLYLVDRLFYGAISQVYDKAATKGFKDGLDFIQDYNGKNPIIYGMFDDVDEDIKNDTETYAKDIQKPENNSKKTELLSDYHLIFTVVYFVIIIITKLIGL